MKLAIFVLVKKKFKNQPLIIPKIMWYALPV